MLGYVHILFWILKFSQSLKGGKRRSQILHPSFKIGSSVREKSIQITQIYRVTVVNMIVVWCLKGWAPTRVQARLFNPVTNFTIQGPARIYIYSFPREVCSLMR
jgi:hypothetical protein